MSPLAKKTGTFAAADGVKIFYRHFAAENEKARLVIAHGLGEHSGRYRHMVERLLTKGFSVWLPDHRGHGLSEGKRGHVLNFMQYLSDLKSVLELAREGRSGTCKCFLLGHSMGGLIALYFALRFDELIDGVVASSPALGMVIEVPAAKKILGSFLSSLWPSLTMSNELDAGKISHDQDVVSAYQNDPLVHDRVSSRLFTELVAAMAAVNQQAAALKGPILMQVAGDDHLVSAPAAVRFFEKLQAPDRTLQVYEGLYHEIYNELKGQREKVLADLEDWLAGRL